MPFDVPYGTPISLDTAHKAIEAAVKEAKMRSFVTPGESFTLTLCCFTTGEEVYITIELPDGVSLSAQSLVTLGPFIVAADGTVAVDVPPLPAGTFQMSLTVDGVTYTIPLMVGVVMPTTGADTFSLLRPAATLLVAGAVIGTPVGMWLLLHLPIATVRLVNKDGDVMWSTTQESNGAKFRGASADVAERITRQLVNDVERVKRR